MLLSKFIVNFVCDSLIKWLFRLLCCSLFWATVFVQMLQKRICKHTPERHRAAVRSFLLILAHLQWSESGYFQIRCAWRPVFVLTTRQPGILEAGPGFYLKCVFFLYLRVCTCQCLYFHCVLVSLSEEGKRLWYQSGWKRWWLWWTSAMTSKCNDCLHLSHQHCSCLLEYSFLKGIIVSVIP